MKYFNYLLFLLIFVSCSNSIKKENKSSSLKLDFIGNDIQYSDIIQNTQLIMLETRPECLISEVSQLEVADSLFFILDRKIETVFVFNSNGKFVSKIGNKGKGPGEYIRPSKFIVNKRKSLIKIYDSSQCKIITFDFNGKLIREIKTNMYLSSFGEFENGYWGYCSNIPNEIIKNKRDFLKFVILDADGNTKKKIYGERTKDKMLLSNSYITTAWNDTVSFVEPYSNTIYQLSDEIIRPHVKIVADEYFISKDYLDKCQNMTPPLNLNSIKLLEYVTKNYFFCFTGYFENEKYIYLFTPYKATSILYNKKEKKVFEFSQLFDNTNWNTFLIPIGIDGNNLFSSISPSQFSQLISDKTSNISIERINSLKYILENTKQTDNPFIIKYEIYPN